MRNPSVVDETPAYAVLFKPPRVHTVPLKKYAGKAGHEPSLLEWYGNLFPPVLNVQGKHPWEGGIVHRLDYETQGLVLVAKTQSALEVLLAQQERGYIIKEYGARATKRAGLLPGFPQAFSGGLDSCIIASGFRPYGPGRKAVRPVVFPVWDGSNLLRKPGKRKKIRALDQGIPYVTEIIVHKNLSVEDTYFRLRIKRGFRHQIRCHLAWIGYPLLNDTLYGGVRRDAIPHWNPGSDRVYGEEQEFPVLGLMAEGIRFYDPVSAEPRHYTIQRL
ncbi:MAG: RNA pseudouridine synthase [Treponema sp.]|jgi:23S rRNA pseudouridine1911/1915/1917 synthase|nr:RNA pseudouridine synthase [Treponema sp.]